MTMDSSPLRRASGAHVVHTNLQERILSLELAPGARLLETEIARELGVSRTPVREALRLLLAEELVVQQPTGGMVVRPLDADDMRELYSVRAALEGLLAREAGERADVTLDAALAGLLEQMRLLVDHAQALRRLGQEFHQRIGIAAGNSRCQLLLRQLQGQLGRYQMVTNLQAARRPETLREHRGIFEAIQARDGELAERLMREHIMAAYRTAATAVDLESADR